MPPRSGSQPQPHTGPFPVFPVQNAWPPETPRRDNRQWVNKTQEDFTSALNAVPPGSDEHPALAGSRPPIVKSPLKERQKKKTVNGMSDLEVWHLDDQVIIDASLAAWKAEVYSHYNLELIRHFKADGSPSHLSYLFRCKTHPENHLNPPVRARANTSFGTTNLKKDVERCQKLQGISSAQKPDIAADAIPYSEANHRALIAMRHAKYNRPINMVADEEYIKEVYMLRPGTFPPSASTLGRDMHRLYEDLSVQVKDYFLSLDGAIHLVLDGWTAPIVSSYLGIVIVWYHQGTIQRAILEFIRLKREHTGEYLAEVVADCVHRWGLEKKLLGICMDNASNCSKMAQILKDKKLIPDFWGMDARLRCLAHIINLVAKIFISFFFKKPKLKKSTVIASGQSNDVTTEFVIEAGEDYDSDDEPAFSEAKEDARAHEQDDGQVVHDEEVVRSLRQIAIQDMAAAGVAMTPYEEREALKLFPVVAGLARRVHDNSVLNSKFKELIAASDLETNKTALDRRVPTRWNSEFDCLKAHLELKEVVQSLTDLRQYKLQKYALSDDLWELAEDVYELFKDLTLLFSKSDLPLVVEAIPMLYTLRDNLQAAADDDPGQEYSDQNSRPTPAVIRIAAHASVLLIDKYINFLYDCDLYIIAMVMCPDRKLQWFKDRGVTDERLREIKSIVVDTWTDHYFLGDRSEVSTSQPGPRRTTQMETKSKWDKSEAVLTGVFPSDDHILVYLQEPPISPSRIKGLGYMKFWTEALSTQPYLARMGLDFCSAPATSVDAERAFSTGRRHVSFLQHNMSSQTFKAHMALGSWAKNPLLSNLTAASKIIQNAMG